MKFLKTLIIHIKVTEETEGLLFFTESVTCLFKESVLLQNICSVKYNAKLYSTIVSLQDVSWINSLTVLSKLIDYLGRSY